MFLEFIYFLFARVAALKGRDPVLLQHVLFSFKVYGMDENVGKNRAFLQTEQTAGIRVYLNFCPENLLPQKKRNEWTATLYVVVKQIIFFSQLLLRNHILRILGNITIIWHVMDEFFSVIHPIYKKGL